MVRLNRWVWTLNNYTDEEFNNITELHRDDTVCKYGVIGTETGETGTPHLQGFTIFVRNHRLAAVRNLISPRAHFEQTRGTNKQASDYCKKDGNFVEHGTFPTGPGERTDLATVIANLVSAGNELGRPLTSPEVARLQPVNYMRQPRLVRTLFHLVERRPPRLGEPRQWQSELETRLIEADDDRTILFCVDPNGNGGKSWFCDYFVDKYPAVAQILTVGKMADVAYNIDPTKHICLFDVSRLEMQHISYRLIESIKNKRVYSTKYTPCWKRFERNTTIIVFSNEEPSAIRLSEDRYVFININ